MLKVGKCYEAQANGLFYLRKKPPLYGFCILEKNDIFFIIKEHHYKTAGNNVYSLLILYNNVKYDLVYGEGSLVWWNIKSGLLKEL